MLFASKPCRNQPIRFLERFRLLPAIALFTIASIVFNAETIAEEANAKSAPSDLQIKAIEKDKPSDNSAKITAPTSETKTKTKKDVEATKDSDKKTEASNSESDEENAVDAVEMLNFIRKYYEKKAGVDNLNDDLILSQSSGYIFLSRRKVRDVSNNILDYWLLSSFEDDLNLTYLVFEAISVKPLTIDLNSDIEARLSLNNYDNPIMSYSEATRKLNAFINFPIPESAMIFVNENSEEVVDISSPSFLQETFSTLNYFVLSLGLVGFSILGYIVYRIIVWAFMLDQNKEYDIQKRRDEDVVAPVDMNVYNSYFFQTPPDKE